jgi:hypothetical protein
MNWMICTLPKVIFGSSKTRMRCAEDVTHTGQRSIQGFWVGKLEGKRPLGTPPCSGEDNPKTYPGNMMRARGRTWIALIWLRTGTSGRFLATR